MDVKRLLDTPPWDWPPDAGDFLLQILQDRRVEGSDRLIAAELAGEHVVFSDDLAAALLEIVGSDEEPDDLRCAAAIALGPGLENADTMGFDDLDDELFSENAYRRTQRSLRDLFLDADLAKPVRRRILEASVRAPEDWHQEAVRTAYSSGDNEWRLTAVFCMRFIRGFDDQILEALDSEDPEIYYQAVWAAGNWGVKAAWPYVAALVHSDEIDKSLLLVAIYAVVGIRPEEAPDALGHLLESDDEDIVAAVHEGLAMAEGMSELEDLDEEDGDEEIYH